MCWTTYNTKKEIVKFIEELSIGVHNKRDAERAQLQLAKGRLVERDLELSLEHTKGQLYEINYILDTITRDRRKNI